MTRSIAMRLDVSLLQALGVSGMILLIASSTPIEAAPPEPPAGVTSLTDYSGDWVTRPALTGDWGGTRQWLADRGLTFEVEWLQVGEGIVSGGIEKRGAYATNLDYYLTLDLMRMGVIPGALVSVRGQSRFGETVNGESGLLLPVNTYSYFPFTTSVDKNVSIALTELNYLQFITEELGFLGGKITTMKNRNEFAGGEGRTQFLNMQFLWSATFAQVAPYSTLAIGAVWAPEPNVSVSSFFMNTADASTSSGFNDIGDGTSWWTSADFQYQLGSLPGGVGAGGIYAFDGEFSEIGGIYIDRGARLSNDPRSTSWAVHGSGWQYLFTEEPAPDLINLDDGRQDLQGIGAFLMVGAADPDTNPVSWSVSCGLGGKGLVPGRDSDTAGLGYFYNRVQDPELTTGQRLAESAHGLEFYYDIALVQSTSLSLDFQWTRSAFEAIDDAFILGLRLDIRL